VGVPEARRTLDVREQKGHRSRRMQCHARPLEAPISPRDVTGQRVAESS
jgi:hypothetical protein